MRLARALLQRGQRLADARAHRAAPVPGFVEVGDQAPGVDQVDRRRDQVERLEEAAHLAGVGQRHERRAGDRGEDQEMQAHAEREVELADPRQQLARGVLALQHRGALRAQHLRDHRVAVLRVEHRFHRHEHHVGVEAVDHEVGGVGEQAVVDLLVQAGRGDAGLAHRHADDAAPAFEPFALEKPARQRLGLDRAAPDPR